MSFMAFRLYYNHGARYCRGKSRKRETIGPLWRIYTTMLLTGENGEIGGDSIAGLMASFCFIGNWPSSYEKQKVAPKKSKSSPRAMNVKPLDSLGSILILSDPISCKVDFQHRWDEFSWKNGAFDLAFSSLQINKQIISCGCRWSSR